LDLYTALCYGVIDGTLAHPDCARVELCFLIMRGRLKELID